MNIYNDIKASYGIQFQDLFSKLMTMRYGSRYIPTSTNGNRGDLKVDGVLDYNTAFAVYAPEIYSDDKTIRKMQDDFMGFIKHRNTGCWRTIDKFIFVIKRERSGVTSTVLNQIMAFRE